MHSSKAQANRILIYVMTIVIVGMVLLFGYKAILSLSTVGEKTGLLKFKNEFTNAVEQGASYGRIAILDFAVGGEYRQLCLAGVGATEASFQHSLVKDALRSNAADNAFLVADATIEPFTVGKLEIENGGQCFSIASGMLKLRLEGKGDRTKVTIATG